MADRAGSIIALALVALGALYAYSAGWFDNLGRAGRIGSLLDRRGVQPGDVALPPSLYPPGTTVAPNGAIIYPPAGSEIPPALPRGPQRILPDYQGGDGAVLAAFGGPGLQSFSDLYGGYHVPLGTPPLVPPGYGGFPGGYQRGGYPVNPWYSPWQGYGRQGQPEPTNDSGHPLGGGVPPGGRPQCAVWHPGCASVVHTGSNTVDSIVSVGSTIAKFLGFG